MSYLAVSTFAFDLRKCSVLLSHRGAFSKKSHLIHILNEQHFLLACINHTDIDFLSISGEEYSRLRYFIIVYAEKILSWEALVLPVDEISVILLREIFPTYTMIM